MVRETGKLYVLRTSEKFFKTLEDQARFSPIADAERGNDFIMTVSGLGRDQRWSAPLMIPQSCALGYEGALFDLGAAASDSAMVFAVQ
jgi:hypothetical protein